MAVTVIEAASLGDAWLAVSRAVLEGGAPASWGGLETRELATLTIEVAHPATADPAIAELGHPAWLAWMHDNFFVKQAVAELGDARSYARRLFDYGAGGAPTEPGPTRGSACRRLIAGWGAIVRPAGKAPGADRTLVPVSTTVLSVPGTVRTARARRRHLCRGGAAFTGHADGKSPA
jgi:hypothetical protein